MYTCVECGAKITKPGRRCRSCAATLRWATTRQPKRQFAWFQGVRYFQQADGYYRASRHAGGALMHRAKWEASRGSIPPEWHVHHIDENPGNNDISNLEALSPPDHLSGQHGERGPHTEQVRADLSAIKKTWWSERLPREHVCEECGLTHLTTAVRVRFCSPACNSKYWNRNRRRKSA